AGGTQVDVHGRGRSPDGRRHHRQAVHGRLVDREAHAARTVAVDVHADVVVVEHAAAARHPGNADLDVHGARALVDQVQAVGAVAQELAVNDVPGDRGRAPRLQQQALVAWRDRGVVADGHAVGCELAGHARVADDAHVVFEASAGPDLG